MHWGTPLLPICQHSQRQSVWKLLESVLGFPLAIFHSRLWAFVTAVMTGKILEEDREERKTVKIFFHPSQNLIVSWFSLFSCKLSYLPIIKSQFQQSTRHALILKLQICTFTNNLNRIALITHHTLILWAFLK